MTANETALGKLDRLDVLRCPECRSRVSVSEERVECRGCSESFPIENGVPLFSYKNIREKGKDTTAEKCCNDLQHCTL